MKNFRKKKRYCKIPEASAIQSGVNAILLNEMIRDIVREELHKCLSTLINDN